MIDGKKVLGVIPARGGSKGLPGKNIREINGRPLIAWSIRAAQGSRLLDRTIVSTDDKDIAGVARTFGCEVPFMRPSELASDTANSTDVALHALEACQVEDGEYGFLVFIEPTSPLRTSDDIDAALELLASHPRAESIVSVAQAEAAHPAFCLTTAPDGLIKPLDSEIKSLRRQDLSEVYFPEGTIYISKVPPLVRRRSFYHELTLAYPVERYKQFEIDEEMDLVMVEALMKWKPEIYGGES